jgi:hypothetical protein
MNVEQRNREILRLQAKQAKAVMPMIGQLLDAWEGIPNDIKSDLSEDCPAFVCYMDELDAAMEAG